MLLLIEKLLLLLLQNQLSIFRPYRIECPCTPIWPPPCGSHAFVQVTDAPAISRCATARVTVAGAASCTPCSWTREVMLLRMEIVKLLLLLVIVKMLLLLVIVKLLLLLLLLIGIRMVLRLLLPLLLLLVLVVVLLRMLLPNTKLLLLLLLLLLLGCHNTSCPLNRLLLPALTVRLKVKS